MRTLVCIFVLLATGSSPTLADTNWQIETSEAIDAVLFIGILSGDPLANERYPDVAENWMRKLSPATREALERLDIELRKRRGSLVGPDLNHLVTRTPHRTLDDLIEWLQDEPRLEHTLEENWQGSALTSTRVVASDLLLILLDLREIGFSKHWYDEIAPQIDQEVPGLSQQLEEYDAALEVSRFFERPVNPDLTILLSYYNQPFGLRIVGQQAYVTNYALSINQTVITAIHELFHPPFDTSNEQLWDVSRPLRSDPWLKNIIENHDPRFTTNSFNALLDEDSTKALDQIVTERMGIAIDPRERWRTQDGGMHMLAAALYHLMIETGFADSGGSYEQWLIDAFESGLLSGEEIRKHAAQVVGWDTVNRWHPNQ